MNTGLKNAYQDTDQVEAKCSGRSDKSVEVLIRRHFFFLWHEAASCIFLLPPVLDASASQGYPPPLASRWRETLWECLAPKHNTIPHPKLEPGQSISRGAHLPWGHRSSYKPSFKLKVSCIEIIIDSYWSLSSFFRALIVNKSPNQLSSRPTNLKLCARYLMLWVTESHQAIWSCWP